MSDEELGVMEKLDAAGVFDGLDADLGRFIRFVIKTVLIPERTHEFVDEPDEVLDRTTLTDKEKKILRNKDFRKGVCRYIVDNRGGPPIIEGGG